MRRPAGMWAGALVLVVGSCGVGVARAADADAARDPIEARAFPVRHRPLADAAELVSAVLSAEGSLSLQPRLGTLVVEDRASILTRVAGLLESFDIPPRNVEVTLTLFLGTDRREEQAGRHAPRVSVSEEVRGVMETLGDFTRWTAYEPLGSRSITGVEGGHVSAMLSDDYRVVFDIAAVEESHGTVSFKNFTLQRMVRTASGSVRYDDVLTADVSLPLGGVHSVGAASGPDSKTALFLTLQARPR